MSNAASGQNDRVGRITSELVGYLVERLRPRKIILFGSRARGSARQGSDIDLAVKGGNLPDFREERKLREELDRLAGIYSIDLVFLEKSDEAFRTMVEKTGKVLYEKN